MNRTPLNSTLVQAVSYSPESRVAHVEFLHGGTYAYHDVPPEDHHAFVNAESHGSHFAKVFKATHGHKAKKIG